MDEINPTNKYHRTNGLVISLFRRPISNPDFNTIDKEFPFLAFGYYDGIRIDKKDCLDQLYSIDHSLEAEKYSSYEEQHLYLYKCQNKIDDDKRVDSIISREYSETNNLLVITELKIDESILISNSLEDCKTEIDQCIEEIKKLSGSTDPPKYSCKFEYELFNSLSYSDFVLIFRATSYEEIDFVINNLRLLKVKGVSFIKSTYSILGFPNIEDFSDAAQCKKHFDTVEKCNVIIQAATNPSKNVVDLEIELRKFVTSLLPENETNPPITMHSVFGKYDVNLLIKEISQYQIIRIRALLLINFYKHIRFTNTRFLFSVPSLDFTNRETKITIDKESIANLLKTKDNETKWIFDSKNNNISTNEFKDLIRKFQHVLLNESINTLVLLEINQLLKAINQNPNSPVLSGAIKMVSDYIDQQNQASQIKFEMPSINSQFIGSVVTITGFYASIVECFEEVVFKEVDKNSDWSIFTIMNHSSTVGSYQYFPESESKNNSKRQELIAISFGKDSFFELRYFIPYLFHEIGHYLPPYVENIEKLHIVNIKGIVYDIAQFILTFLHNKINFFIFTHDNIKDFGDRLIKKVSVYLQNEIMSDLKKIRIGTSGLLQLPLNYYVDKQVFNIIMYILFGHYNDTIFELYTFDQDIVNLEKITKFDFPSLFEKYENVLDTLMEKINSSDISDFKKNEFNIYYRNFQKLKETFFRLESECITSGSLTDNFNAQIDIFSGVVISFKKTIDDLLNQFSIIPISNFQQEFISLVTQFQKIIRSNSDRIVKLWDEPTNILYHEIQDSIKLIVDESNRKSIDTLGYFEELETALMNLSHYGTLEDNPSNRKKFLKLLLDDFNSSESRDAMRSDNIILFTILKETRADYYMCRFLGLNHRDFLEIAEDNLAKQSLHEHDELFAIRSEILKNALHEGVASCAPNVEISSGIKSSINQLYYSFYTNEITDYLINTQSKECEQLEKVKGSIIQDLREKYCEILHNKDSTFTQEVKLIEHYINKSNEGWKKL